MRPSPNQTCFQQTIADQIKKSKKGLLLQQIFPLPYQRIPIAWTGKEQKNGKNEQIGFSSRCHISLWYCTLPTVDLRYTFGVGCSIFKRIQCKIFDKYKMFKLYKNTISEKAKNEGSSPYKSCSTCITKLFGKYENITCHPHLVQIKIQIQIRIAFITIYTKKTPATRTPLDPRKLHPHLLLSPPPEIHLFAAKISSSVIKTMVMIMFMTMKMTMIMMTMMKRVVTMTLLLKRKHLEEASMAHLDFIHVAFGFN